MVSLFMHFFFSLVSLSGSFQISMEVWLMGRDCIDIVSSTLPNLVALSLLFACGVIGMETIHFIHGNFT